MALTAAIVLAIVLTLDYALTPASSLQKSAGTFPRYEASTPNDSEVFSGIVRLLTTEGRFNCSAGVVSDEYAVTAAHCVCDNRGNLNPTYKIQDEAKSVTIPVKIVGLNHRLDYALIHGNFKSFKKFKLDQQKVIIENSNPLAALLGVGGPSRSLKSCGYPMGSTKIYCSDFMPMDNYNFAVVGKGTLYPGMSGGPVFDTETNEILAVNSAVVGNMSLVGPLIGIISCFNVD